MSAYRLSAAAKQDIIDILAWSAERFGKAARQRYRALLRTAISDIASDPTRPGSKTRPELGDGIRSWHLSLSRRRSPVGSVRMPRHFLIYRVGRDGVTIVRVLHDAMDIGAQVESRGSAS